MKKLLNSMMLVVALLGLSGCVPQTAPLNKTALNKTVETDYFTYRISDTWKHENRLKQDCYFLNEEASSSMETPTIFVQPDVKTDKSYNTLEEQRSYLERAFANTADTAQKVSSEITSLGEYAAYKEEVNVSASSSDQKDYTVRSLVFFVSPNTIASMYYASPGDEYGQFLHEADGVFDSIVLRS